MTHEHPHRTAYADLLDDHDDPVLARLVDDLDQLYRPAGPPPHVVAAVARTLARQRNGHYRAPTPRRQRGRWPVPRLAAAIAAVLALFVAITAGATAMAPILARTFALNPSVQHIAADNLGQELNLVQTSAGFSVTIGRVYADANQIVIGYTISGPPDRTFVDFGAHDNRGNSLAILTDAHGRAIPQLPSILVAAKDGGASGLLLTYDGAAIAAAPATITLHLTIVAIRAVEQVGDLPPTGTVRPTSPCDERAIPLRCVMVPGPFTFDFTVPFEAGRAAELQRPLSGAGAAVTLERVVTTRTTTRVQLQGVGPDAAVELLADGTTYKLQPPGAIPLRWTPESVWDYLLPASLLDRHGEWTLIVRPGHARPGDTRVEGGPWTIRFVVP